jgi:hypothetical protein
MDITTYLVLSHINNTKLLLRLIENYCDIKIDVTLEDSFIFNLKERLNKDLFNGIAQKRNLKKIFEPSFDQLPTWLIKNNSSTKYRQVQTINGIKFDVVKSALQKYIRRGHDKKAMRIATEIDTFRWIKGGKGLITNFYNRLRVIILEDIGLASPNIILIADELLRKWIDNYENISNDLLSLVRLMSNCSHVRFYSHLRAYLRQNPPEYKPEAGMKYNYGDANLANDINSIIYCLENKDTDLWYFVNDILKNTLTVPIGRMKRPGMLVFDIFDKFIKEYNVDNNIITIYNICKRWYRTLKLKEDFLCVIHPMYLYILFDHISWDEINPDMNIDNDQLKYYKMCLLNKPINVESYIVDMHTAHGRKLKMNTADFAVEGSLVAYEFKIPDTEMMAETYSTTKISQGKVSSEKQEFIYKARTQLTCSNVRPDVYFARDIILGNNVVVKGPFQSYEDAIKTFNVQSIMSLFKGVNNFDVNIKLLYCDMFNLADIPIGSRTKLDLTEPHYFVVMQDLFNLDDYPIEIKSSKLWAPTEVVDYKKLFESDNYGFGEASTMTDEQRFSLLIQLTFRYVFKIGDFATRNIIRIRNKIYNIDTEGILINNKLRTKKTERELLNGVYKDNISRYKKILTSWLSQGIDLQDKWYIVKVTFGISDGQITEIQDEIKKLLQDGPTHNLLNLV